MVTINGERQDVAGKNLYEYLVSEGYNITQVVVERNFDIISKDDLANITIQDEDVIEVLRFVGWW